MLTTAANKIKHTKILCILISLKLVALINVIAWKGTVYLGKIII